jgi:hypothetical protein
VLARTYHSTIPSTIAHTWAHEGIGGFYRGLGHEYSGCVQARVVYENLAWLLKRTPSRRNATAKADAEVGAGDSIRLNG